MAAAAGAAAQSASIASEARLSGRRPALAARPAAAARRGRVGPAIVAFAREIDELPDARIYGAEFRVNAQVAPGFAHLDGGRSRPAPSTRFAGARNAAAQRTCARRPVRALAQTSSRRSRATLRAADRVKAWRNRLRAAGSAKPRWSTPPPCRARQGGRRLRRCSQQLLDGPRRDRPDGDSDRSRRWRRVRSAPGIRAGSSRGSPRAPLRPRFATAELHVSWSCSSAVSVRRATAGPGRNGSGAPSTQARC